VLIKAGEKKLELLGWGGWGGGGGKNKKKKKNGKCEHNEMIKVNESITVQLEHTIDILCTGLIVVGNTPCPQSCFDWQR